MPGAQLAEGELEEHAGLAETGRRLEEHERVLFERCGQLDLRCLLAGTQHGEGVTGSGGHTQPLAGAEAEVEELGDALELRAEERVIREA